MTEDKDLNKQVLLGLDWWELTEKVFVCCVWEQEIAVDRGAVPSAACRDCPNPRQAFGRACCTWVEQQLDHGGEREESELRANAGQFRSRRGGGRTENSCLHVFLSHCSSLCSSHPAFFTVNKTTVIVWSIFEVPQSLHCSCTHISRKL